MSIYMHVARELRLIRKALSSIRNLERKMYVTRPLSMYLRDPSTLSLPRPEGPHSGILVIQDEEAAQPTCCFGFCKSSKVKNLPFPQNKNLRVEYYEQYGQNGYVHTDRVLFIPVLDQPLSSNRYYVIARSGKHKGEAYTSSTEEDMKTCCFCNCVSDREPKPLNPHDVFQQFEIQLPKWCCGYVGKSVAPNAYPPEFLRRKGWKLYTSREIELNEAPGLETTLRDRLPDFNFLISESCVPVVVGKWYVPFMFVREGAFKDQVDSSVYYKMTLEQRWEQIFACENNYKEGNAVTVDVAVETEAVAVAGREVAHNKNYQVGKVMWFKSFDETGGETSVGLSLAVVERMKWEQGRFGWVGGTEGQVRVKKVEEFGGTGEWRKFGCYVLVERFVLKRMNGSLLLTYDFRHTHQVRCKWEK